MVAAIETRAVIVNIDLGVGLFLDGADHLAARADDGADFFHRHFDDRNTRRMRFQLWAGRGDGFKDFVQDKAAGHVGLRQGFCMISAVIPRILMSI